MIKQIESDGTANLCKSDHVGMLSQEAFVTEDTNPLYGNTMPEFAEEMMSIKKMMIIIW